MPTEPKMYLNGRIVDYADCRIHAFASVVKYGTGVFEGLRAYYHPQRREFAIFRLDDHLKRLETGMKLLRFDRMYERDYMKDCLAKLIRANEPDDDVYIRLLA